ncbi:hypothetical protein ILUMI_02531 [Ignelater luminosus]|uniref:uS12 prolyl 3-hydroxylase n=1 Tax=Ignelater luminosus TaxID=2038154 RepID=A0A8K0D5F9_IGNLU|nr:hypothetical protein ILUMI_02531 [Ignelater luminosus]
MEKHESLSEESDSEMECEDWDNSTIVHLQPKVEKRIYGFHLMPTCIQDPSTEPPSKQSKLSLELREALTTSTFADNFKKNWNNHKEFTVDNIELIVDPFKVCVIQNFLKDDFIINKVLEEFNELEWNKRNLDLYEFFQSSDLKHIDSKYTKIVYEFLKHNVKNWVQNLTGQELTDISATCSLYSDTDYLLLHDDQQEDRLIAFVLYFTGPRTWQASNGGALQLFSKDESGQPYAAVKNIVPCNNQFVFFQVTNDSYHQVSEVLNKNDCRMSINGWFHTKVPPVFNVPPYVPSNFGLFSNTSTKPQELDLDLESWINPEYLDSETAHYIQEHIEEHSEISLHNYFKEEAFQEVLNDLQHHNVNWTLIGPPNRRSYEVALEQETMPSILQRFINLFQSYQMFSLLKQYTDLDLTSVRFELQRWTPGCYSLLTDYDWSQKNELDLVLFLGCPKISSVIGGRIMYVSTEEEIQQALITLEPEDNNLNIVFRDTARITKYVSKYSSCSVYYLLICSYSE